MERGPRRRRAGGPDVLLWARVGSSVLSTLDVRLPWPRRAHNVAVGAARSGDHRPPAARRPGLLDALSARLVEQAGFDAVYMTGFGTTASLLGRPDVGLLGLAEMVDNARRITATITVPLVADADTGYGNPINVIRTVREYERAGVAALHIEDQVMPKRCGHMENKQVIDTASMTAKIRAAVAARSSDEFLVIARTDSRATHGLDEALRRASAFADAGADVLFVEALLGEDESSAWQPNSPGCRCSSTGPKAARRHH